MTETENQKAEKHKAILLQGNAAISAGNNEGFLAFCADDTEWNFIGERILQGKQAVRDYMASNYVEPPQFTIDYLIAEGDFLTAVGEIEMKDKDGTSVRYSYCDVWKFRDDKIVELRAFVIKNADL